jgi:hypothetical protein
MNQRLSFTRFLVMGEPPTPPLPLRYQTVRLLRSTRRSSEPGPATSTWRRMRVQQEVQLCGFPIVQSTGQSAASIPVHQEPSRAERTGSGPPTCRRSCHPLEKAWRSRIAHYRLCRIGENIVPDSMSSRVAMSSFIGELLVKIGLFF